MLPDPCQVSVWAWRRRVDTRVDLGPSSLFSPHLSTSMSCVLRTLQIGEAAKFFSRGIRLLVSDVGNSSRLFMKAAFGAHQVSSICGCPALFGHVLPYTI